MKVSLLPKGLQFEVAPDEWITEAAARADIRLPVSCRNGVCELCEATLLQGELETGSPSSPVRTSRAGSRILLCRSKAVSPCTIEIEHVLGPGELPLKKLVCEIESVAPILAHVYQVKLRLPAGKAPEFFAGQYLALHLPGKDQPSFYSIASAPGSPSLELHIQADPHIESACEVIDHLRAHPSVEVTLPHGRACLAKAPTQNVVLLAAGTGFAQMKSIIEYLLATEFDHDIYLYWGVRQAQDMYLKEYTERWSQANTRFHFVSLIADIDDEKGMAHHDQLSDAVIADQHDFSDSLVFVAGSPRLVFSALDHFEQAGLPEAQFFSDVLEYVERPAR